MSTTTGIEAMIAERRTDILRIAHEHGAIRVRVFGSVARGESGPESDLDLLIDLGPGRDLFDHIAIKQNLEDLLGLRVDVVTEAGLNRFIRDQVRQEAIPL